MLNLLKKTALALCAFGLMTGLAPAAYPEHSITLIVPFGAGGGTDIPARLLAGMMEKKLGQPIIIQNIAGAGGTQGAAQIASAKADGYTFGYVPVGTMCLQPHMLNLPYGTDAFDFIGMVTRQPVVIMSSKSAPWSNIQECIAAIKKNPNKYIAGITSTGNMTHLPVIEFARHFGLKLRYIPYRSTPEIMKDMMAGRIQLHADAPAALSKFDVYGLLQFSDKRADNLDMPTTRELGMTSAFSHWQGVVAPAGIPAAAKKTFEKVMQDVVTSTAFQAEALKLKTKANWMPSAAFNALYKQELTAYGAILREALPQK